MTTKQRVPITLEAGLAMYRPLVAGFEQAVPILTLGFSTPFHDDSSYAVGRACPRDLLLLLADRQSGPDPIAPPPRWAMYTAEAWIKTEAEGAKLTDLEHGDLQRRHEAGDGTVGECVMICCFDGQGEVFSGMQAFMRSDSGVIWGEVEDTTETKSEGVLAEAMAAICGVGRG